MGSIGARALLYRHGGRFGCTDCRTVSTIAVFCGLCAAAARAAARCRVSGGRPGGGGSPGGRPARRGTRGRSRRRAATRCVGGPTLARGRDGPLRDRGQGGAAGGRCTAGGADSRGLAGVAPRGGGGFAASSLRCSSRRGRAATRRSCAPRPSTRPPSARLPKSQPPAPPSLARLDGFPSPCARRPEQPGRGSAAGDGERRRRGTCQ